MARVFIVRNNVKEPIDVLWTVDQPVGPSCPNRRDDVLLVQFLLRSVREAGGGAAGFIPPGETAQLVIDGTFGKHTAAHIKLFQEEDGRRNPGAGPVTDGRVDPLTTGAPFGARTGKLLAIGSLNLQYVKRKGKSIHNNINQDPLFPVELTKSFFV